jgi:hypothetical protein
MSIFSVSWGYGKSHNVAWYAAMTDDEVRRLWVAQFKWRKVAEIRSVNRLRAVQEGDDVTGPGPIIFSHGVGGPVRSFTATK